LLEERVFSGLDAIHVRVDIAPDQTIEKGKDAHPNEIGHQALAKAVLDALAPKASP
jgi:lysophospholipase L1-like esterase